MAFSKTSRLYKVKKRFQHIKVDHGQIKNIEIDDKDDGIILGLNETKGEHKNC